MSKEIAEKIILHAQKDPDFMHQILHNPLETLKEYDLTATERDFFQHADETTLRGLSPACFKLAEKK